MKAHQSKGFATERRASSSVWRGAGKPGQPVYVLLYDVTLGWILRKLWVGISKIFVALRYRLHRATAGWFAGWRLSWWRLGLAVLVIFIVLKKDIQFSINMRAPAASAMMPAVAPTAKPTQTSQPQSDELSLLDAIGLKGKTTPKAASVEELDEQRVQGYIHRFTKVAQVEMQKFGIPASIKMAQGIIESRAGSIQSHNHFGAPLAEAQYNNAWENWRAHSLLLRGQYPQLFELDSSYQKWAKALKNYGYNPDKNYDKKLISVIEKYNLQRLDIW